MSMQNVQMSQAPIATRAASPMSHAQQINMSSVPQVGAFSLSYKHTHGIYLPDTMKAKVALNIIPLFCVLFIYLFIFKPLLSDRHVTHAVGPSTRHDGTSRWEHGATGSKSAAVYAAVFLQC